jgi:hypothetical protein
MDDSLEIPNAIPPQEKLPVEADDEQSSEEEDGAPDWTKLL